MAGPSLRPRWPAGPVPFLALVGMVLGLVTAHVPSARVGPLLWVYKFALFIFRKHVAFATVMNLAVLAHIVEAAILAGMSKRMGNTLSDTCGWTGMALLIGYPSIESFQAEAAKHRPDVVAKRRTA